MTFADALLADLPLWALLYLVALGLGWLAVPVFARWVRRER